MDVVATSGTEPGKRLRGIFEVTGDVLRICIGEERPSAFRGVDGAALIELRREPPSA